MTIKRVFHGTCDSFVRSIKSVGLEPGRGNGADAWAAANGFNNLVEAAKLKPPSVYVTNDRFWAEQFANLVALHNSCRPRVLEFEIPSEHFEAHFVSDEQTADAESGERAYRSERTVSSKWMKRVHSDIRSAMLPI